MSRTKNTQLYYPHNANARNEDNMIRLRMSHGVAGYGVYHMLLERLRMADGYKCELDYDILSWDLACDAELIRSVIYDFGLFEIVDNGQMFCSVELNSYMKIMEEKKAERRRRAQEAANARWGNHTVPDDSTKVSEQASLPLNIEEDIVNDSERLDTEIKMIKEDNVWLETMAKESGRNKDELISFLDDFKNTCILKGMKGGHKDMIDTLSHFRSWIYKSGRAKDPNVDTGSHMRGKTTISAPEIHQRLDKQAFERDTEFDKREKNKANIRRYIMNKGYDPSEVTMVAFGLRDWEKNNPPTHPEWIGKFEDPIPVPY